MKKSKSSEEPIALALRQAKGGSSVQLTSVEISWFAEPFSKPVNS